MATHTPGPRTVSASKPDDYALSIHGVQLETGGFHVVADIPERTIHGTHEANARLIAAAPELLVALGNLLATLEHADLHDGVCCCGDPIEGHSDPMACGHSPVDAGQYYGSLSIAEAQAAIAKATGKA